MRSLLALQDRLLSTLGSGDTILAFAARFTFAATLALYYFNSGLTKLGDGIFGIFQPSDGAYLQIFPRAMAAADYDSSSLGFLLFVVLLSGLVFRLFANLCANIPMIPSKGYF